MLYRTTFVQKPHQLFGSGRYCPCDRIIPVGKTQLRTKIDAELEQARQSRTSGNEGKARVCARRAVGFALAAHIHEKYAQPASRNAYLNLKWFAAQDDVPAELRLAAERLSTHVGADHVVPFKEDPLNDAQVLIEALLSGSV
jgi:hypothetical protein